MGLFKRKKTFIDMQYMNLLEPDVSIKSAKKQTMFTTDGMEQYNKTYWMWKHQYRNRYSEKYMEKKGFEAWDTGETLKFNEDKVYDYVKLQDPDLDEILEVHMTFVQIEIQMRYYLQRNGYDWSNRDKILKKDGVEYHMYSVTYKENDDPDTPDDESIIVGTFKDIDEIEDDFILEIPNYYTNYECMIVKYTRIPPAEPDEWFLYIQFKYYLPDNLYTTKSLTMTPIITMKENEVITKSTLEMRKMMNRMNVNGKDFEEVLTQKIESGKAKGQQAIDNAYLLNAIPTMNPYEVAVGTYNERQAEHLQGELLRRIKKDGNRTKVREARNGRPAEYAYYLSEKVQHDWYFDHLKEQSYLARALFRTFGYYTGHWDPACEQKKSNMRFVEECIPDGTYVVGSGENGEISFGKDGLSMTLRFTVSVVTFTGKIRPDQGDGRTQGMFHFSGERVFPKDENGHRQKSITWDSKGYDLLEIKVQINETQYQVMRVTDYRQNLVISGHNFTYGLGWPYNEHRLILPYFALNRLKFNEFVTVHEYSFFMIAYSKVVVKIKWWKALLGFLIGLVLCVFSGGAGCNIVMFILKAILTFVVSMVLQQLLALIDNQILQLLLGVIISLFQMMGGTFDLSSITFEGYMQIAKQVADGVFAIQKAEEMKTAAIDAKNQQAEENIEKKIENIDSMMSLSPKAIMTAHMSHQQATSSETFYANALGENLYNWDQYFNFDGSIELRKQVVSG